MNQTLPLLKLSEKQTTDQQPNDTSAVKFAETQAHTPGPWFVSRVSGVGGDRLVSSNVDSEDNDLGSKKNGGIRIARTMGPDAPANAHLIAAAPDMLALIQTLDRWWTEEWPGGPDDTGAGISLTDDTINHWRNMRAAISRATGAAS